MDQSATNSMADATYFNWRQNSFSLLTACNEGRTAFSYHQNASTHGPPTSSAVLVNLGSAYAATQVPC